jgi:hypothetical protein
VELGNALKDFGENVFVVDVAKGKRPVAVEPLKDLDAGIFKIVIDLRADAGLRSDDVGGMAVRSVDESVPAPGIFRKKSFPVDV